MKKSTSKKVPSTKPRTQSSSFDLDLVREVTEFMKSNDLVELEVKIGKDEIRLRRSDNKSSQVPGYFVPPMMPAHAATAAAPAAAASATVAADATPKKKYHLITSPFVGTFYRAAGPNQDPFVEAGQVVASGDTLCIVEAMKLMNEIESDTKGRIVSVLVENGTPVEFGEPLFEIDPV